MRVVLLELSKYAFAFMMAFYVAAAYYGAYRNDESRRKVVYILENCIMFVTHLLGYFILYINNNEEIRYLMLYMAQLIYLFVVVAVFDIFYPKASRLLINNMCMLISVGFVVIARLDFEQCVKQFVIACGSTLICIFIPWLIKKVKKFRNMSWAYCAIGLALLVVVLFSNKVYGANLVLTVGPVSVQPGEFVKILYVMFVASMFNKSVDFRQTVITTVMAALHVIILVVSKDLGAALIFFVVYVCMLYVASRRLDYMLAGFAAGGVASVIAYRLFSHVRERVEIWLNPWSTIDTSGYQICQSLFSIGMGSWFGFGLCQGMPDKIPVVQKDFVFSAIVEEFGVIYAIGLILLCLNNLILMMKIASRCKTLFYRLVAVGLGVTYGFQVFLTVGGAMKMIPMTGVTLPFVSYGGSSMLSSLVIFAIINGMYNMRQDEVDAYEKAGKSKKTKKEKGK